MRVGRSALLGGLLQKLQRTHARRQGEACAVATVVKMVSVRISRSHDGVSEDLDLSKRQAGDF